MQRAASIVLPAGFIVVMVSIWILLRPPAAAKDGGSQKLLVCSKCRKQVEFKLSQLGQDCPECGPKGKLAMEVGRMKSSDEGSGRVAWIVPVVTVEIAFIAACMYVVVRRSRTLENDSLPRTRCPQCSMKLRYRPSMAGQPGKCPQCKHVFAFPDPAIAETGQV